MKLDDDDFTLFDLPARFALDRAVLDEPAGQRAVVEQCTQFAWGGADSAGRQAAGRHHPAHRGRLAGHPFGVQRDHHSAATIVLAASAITQATTNM